MTQPAELAGISVVKPPRAPLHKWPFLAGPGSLHCNFETASKARRACIDIARFEHVLHAALRVVGLGAMLVIIQCSPAKTPQPTAEDPNKAGFLAIIERMLRVGDLRDYREIGTILGVSFSEIRYPTVFYMIPQGLHPRTGDSPLWLGDIGYSLLGTPPGSGGQDITLHVGDPLCVTPVDVRAWFGAPTLPSRHLPVSPIFIDKKKLE